MPAVPAAIGQDADDDAGDAPASGEQPGDQRGGSRGGHEDAGGVAADDEGGTAEVVQGAGELGGQVVGPQVRRPSRGAMEPSFTATVTRPAPSAVAASQPSGPLPAAQHPVEGAEEDEEGGEAQDLERQAEVWTGEGCAAGRQDAGPSSAPVLPASYRPLPIRMART